MGGNSLSLLIKRKDDLERAVEFHLKSLGPLPEWEKHYRKAIPGRRYEIDFCWPEFKVGIEVQGGIWLAKTGKKSGHIGAGAVRDFEKLNLLAEHGWIILQWSTDMIRRDPMGLIDQLKRILKNRGWRNKEGVRIHET
ncbi:MAG: hypothetical protein KJ556_21330 [Gammaproteobacteria bacterium]|nr:hypothetical protein [Gammaproteobacteria bacterium]